MSRQQKVVGCKLPAVSCKLLAVSFLILSLAHADYSADMDRVAGALVKAMPKGMPVVVVLNIPRYDDLLTRNSVEIARKLTGRIAAIGVKRCSVIDRATGEKLYQDEEFYSPKTSSQAELESLLSHFRADVGITGTYHVTGRTLNLDLQLNVIAGPNQPPVVKLGNNWKLKFTPDDSAYCWACEKTLPGADTSNMTFLKAHTDSLFATASLADDEGRQLDNNSARIGTDYRLAVDVKRPVFLYVFSYDEDARDVYLMHSPNQELAATPVGKCQMPETYQAIAPPGRVAVIVIASLKPLQLDIPDRENQQLLPAEVADFARQLKTSLKESEWSSYMVFAHVVP
jgi:hypothetical protein